MKEIITGQKGRADIAHLRISAEQSKPDELIDRYPIIKHLRCGPMQSDLARGGGNVVMCVLPRTSSEYKARQHDAEFVTDCPSVMKGRQASQ